MTYRLLLIMVLFSTKKKKKKKGMGLPRVLGNILEY